MFDPLLMAALAFLMPGHSPSLLQASMLLWFLGDCESAEFSLATSLCLTFVLGPEILGLGEQISGFPNPHVAAPCRPLWLLPGVAQ